MSSPELWPYGSEPRPEAPEGIWVTTADLLSVLGDWTEPLQWIVRTFPVSWVSTEDLCSKQWAEYEDIGPLDWANFVVNPFSHQDFYKRLVARYLKANWFTYCQLIPAPDPIEEPLPPEPELPAPPPVTVDPPPPPAVSTTLDEIGILLSWVFRDVGAMRPLIEYLDVLCRWIAKHTSSLTFTFGEPLEIEGTGTAFLNPADGYMVQLTVVPAYVGRTSGGIPTYFDAGWFGYGPFPMQQRKERLAHQAQVFYPAGYECHSISWQLAEGVEATVTPLIRDPYPEAPAREPFEIGG